MNGNKSINTKKTGKLNREPVVDILFETIYVMWWWELLEVEPGMVIQNNEFSSLLLVSNVSIKIQRERNSIYELSITELFLCWLCCWKGATIHGLFCSHYKKKSPLFLLFSSFFYTLWKTETCLEIQFPAQIEWGKNIKWVEF